MFERDLITFWLDSNLFELSWSGTKTISNVIYHINSTSTTFLRQLVSERFSANYTTFLAIHIHKILKLWNPSHDHLKYSPQSTTSTIIVQSIAKITINRRQKPDRPIPLIMQQLHKQPKISELSTSHYHKASHLYRQPTSLAQSPLATHPKPITNHH